MFIKENLERESAKSKRRLMNVVRLSKKPSRIQNVETIVSSAAMGEIVSGFPPIPGIDLVNKGGKTISDLALPTFTWEIPVHGIRMTSNQLILR